MDAMSSSSASSAFVFRTSPSQGTSLFSGIDGNAESKQPFDENAWELYNLNEDYTERIDLAKKYPEKLAELKALFEEQAKVHHLYPYITWDDVFHARIHRTPGAKPFCDAAKNVTKAGD